MNVAKTAREQMFATLNTTLETKQSLYLFYLFLFISKHVSRHVLLPRSSVLAVRQRAGAGARVLPAADGAGLVPVQVHQRDGPIRH